jgi:hypothetical protein
MYDISSLTLEYRRECNQASVVESLTNMEQGTNEIGEFTPAASLQTQVYVNGDGTCSDSAGFSTTLNDSIAAFFPRVLYNHLLRVQGGKAEEIVRGRTQWKPRCLSQ